MEFARAQNQLSSQLLSRRALTLKKWIFIVSVVYVRSEHITGRATTCPIAIIMQKLGSILHRKFKQQYHICMSKLFYSSIAKSSVRDHVPSC